MIHRSCQTRGVELTDQEYLRFVGRAVHALCDIVRDLGDDLANTRADVPGANTAVGLLTHCLGVVEYCLVSEELARAWMSVGSIIARGNGTGCASPDPDRRAELLRASAAGRWVGAIAFSEPHAGSDLAGVECTATRTDDGWVVEGTKRWVGHALSADFLHLPNNAVVELGSKIEI